MKEYVCVCGNVKPKIPKPVFQVVDLKTLEMPDERKIRKQQEKEVYPKSTKEQDDAMIAEFLAKRAKGEI